MTEGVAGEAPSKAPVPQPTHNTPTLLRSHRQSLFCGGDRIIPIQACDEGRAYFGGTDGFALVVISAIPETEFIHLPNHMESATFAFCLTLREKTEVRDFGRDEQHRRGIWACGHAGAASNAGGGFH